MKIAVIGSRTFDDYELLKRVLDVNLGSLTQIISGGARGADALAEKYANENAVPIKIFKPQWNKYQNSAGIIRNKDIIDACDRVIAFWDKSSKGTLFSIEYAKKTKKSVKIYEF